MQHLETERLAALDHDPPGPAELAHLAACAACRVERDAFAALAQLAVHAGAVDETPDAARLTDWTVLSAQLRSEGLLRTTGEHAIDAASSPLVVRSLHGVDESGRHRTAAIGRTHAGSRRASPRWLQAAAALLLVLGGAALGRMSTAESASFATAGATDVAAQSVITNDGFASVEEATRVLATAQRNYEIASLWLASNDTTVTSPDVYRARLAALDQMMAASRAALHDAPQDPVLNHYYLAAYTAREATLQQLVSTLPVDKTIEGF